MGRGNNFNHKQKGHEPTKPKVAANAPAKHTADVEYAIETVAKDGNRPVTIKVEK
ncbi:hypothetical protein ACFFIX_09275 [Metabacillus herbersteinensis]|uniref:Uncharacterized protein n=1 Tax=Metabacillus herbersteinensis TaxID=283816 RepID=A0ABV6GFF5_9BACI